MTTQDLSEGSRVTLQRSRRGGSIGLVLLVATMLVGAAFAFLLIGRGRAEPYILGLLAVLAVIGVFALFALAAGILRIPGRDEVDPLIKAITDTANDGLVVTDQAGRVVYANATYLNLVNAVDANDVRPVERVFVGDPDVSEAVYRLAKAART
jgi:two-component system cell cycle sensor histidine kinase/response regulator CckA